MSYEQLGQANKYQLYIDWQLVYTAYALKSTGEREKSIIEEIKQKFAGRIENSTSCMIFKTEKKRIE